MDYIIPRGGLKFNRILPAMKKTRMPAVGVILGSRSDVEAMEPCLRTLREMGIPYEARVLSAHRAPGLLAEYARSAGPRGLKVLIAGAGMAAALPGMAAAMTSLPVIGVPVESGSLKGLDALLSIVQMPPGVPVAAVAIGGARNAALLAARILALGDAALSGRLDALRGEAEALARKEKSF